MGTSTPAVCPLAMPRSRQSNSETGHSKGVTYGRGTRQRASSSRGVGWDLNKGGGRE